MVNRKCYKYIDLKKNVKPDIFQSQFVAQIRQEWLEVTKKFCARRCTLKHPSCFQMVENSNLVSIQIAKAALIGQYFCESL
jgi:hypothetical protein